MNRRAPVWIKLKNHNGWDATYVDLSDVKIFKVDSSGDHTDYELYFYADPDDISFSSNELGKENEAFLKKYIETLYNTSK